MSLRSRIAERPAGRSVEVAKVYGPGAPESFRQGEIAAQMTPASPFSPGQPIGPYDGYDRQPRAHDFVTGYNIATRPRTHERVSFDTLTGLIEAYDVAQLAIWHRIDSIRSLDWKLIAEDGYQGDVTDAIAIGMAALRKPDRINSFEAWLAKWLYDVLAYDAGCLYRMRNRGGRCIGLAVVDGRSVAPLLDYWGNPPGAMALPGEPLPASHVQYVNGLPWNWLTWADLIYEPFRPVPNSPYGRAPLESIILNANTDIRFQLYFLQRFTSGNLPAAFAAAPESWSPEQIEQFQTYWDAMMYGDQTGKHQIKWMPPGSKFEWSNEKDFSDVFSLFLMRKSLAAYHVVPSDMGFTEDVNRSSGESQADVQHRIGDLPLLRYVQRIITSFVKDDLGLPLRHAFDLGEEQDDRYQQAQSDDIYLKGGVIGASELREMRFGLPEPQGRPVPRFIFSNRAGPIPLSSLVDVAGPVDESTGAPVPGIELPHKEFQPVEGVVPVPPPPAPALAEREYGPSAIPPAPPGPPGPPALPPGQPVAKEGEAAPGISSETGIYGDPLIRGDEDEEGRPPLPGEPGSPLQPVTEGSGGRYMTLTEAKELGRAALVKSELAAFGRFRAARRKSGEWRDFQFKTVGPVAAHNLNDSGRLAVRKAAGEVAVAGLAVLAADTGRVLMLQRALCDDDPAAGKLEFPGGHLEDGEMPLEAAWREWSEETGAVPPPGTETGSWVSPDGIYQGIVWTTAREASVPVRGDAFVPNPDDPDGDAVEAILWFDPADLPGNPAVRAELLENINAVLAALGLSGDGQPGCCGSECCGGGCCDGAGGCTCGMASSGEADQVVAAVEKRRGELAGIDRLMRTPPGPWRGQRARHRTGSDDHLEHGVTKAGGARPKAPRAPR